MRSLALIKVDGTPDEGVNASPGSKVDLPTNPPMINCPTILTGMSHEVRTYMNAIVAFSYLMNRDSNNQAEREDFSRQIQASCDQLIGLLENFLDTAIIDTGKHCAGLKLCRPDNELEILLTEFRETIKREGKSDVVLISECACTDSAELIFDADRVFRVIRILLHNALKNTKTGYIRAGYEFRDNRVTFHVLDSGQGFFKCKEFLHTEDLNESLAKYDDTVSAINITLAKKIILILGGEINIECNGLTGSAIHISVPARDKLSPDLDIDKLINSMIAI